MRTATVPPCRALPTPPLALRADAPAPPLARERGEQQLELLKELTAGKDRFDEIDLDAAVDRVHERMTPLPA